MIENYLATLKLTGFKSIAKLDGLEFGPCNVLIGANGSGKSNLIGFFRMLAWILAPPGQLQWFVGRSGGGSALLHCGAETTPTLAAQMTVETRRGRNEYRFRLAHAASDTLIFVDEAYRFSDRNLARVAPWRELGAGHREAKLNETAGQGDQTARTVAGLLRRIQVFQFHNTSETSRMKIRWDVEDNRYLREDGGNLAAFLLRMKDNVPPYYGRIVDTIRQIVPFFADFVLDPQDRTVYLQWREVGSDLVFGAHQAADGMLRAMALVALLLQPPDTLPTMLILDEPELGLHPYAVDVVTGLIRSVSVRQQVLIATQSPSFVAQFEPEEVVVVERPAIGGGSTFRRLDSSKLGRWLDVYSLGELWEKNVLGGRPG